MEQNPLEQLLKPGQHYRLRRVYNSETNRFEYQLTLSGGVTIGLADDLGVKLAGHWKQNEYATFLGRHTMEWIIEKLDAQENPNVEQ